MKSFVKFGVVLLVQAGLAFAVVTFVAGPMMRGEPLPWQKEPAPEEDQARKLGPLLPMEEILVNVADTQGRRYFKTSLTLEMGDKELEKQATERMPVLRGKVIDLLSQKKMDELVQPAARDTLRMEILKTLNSEMSAGQFRDLYFTEFLVQ